MGQDRWERTGTSLGGGGQAQVFRVTDGDGELGGEFALKELHYAEREPRIHTEISQMKSLHDAGAPVLEIIDDYTEHDDDEDPWFVTPIASDGSLDDHIPDDGPYGGDTEAALQKFREIVRGVQNLHERGVAHRDLKPENIFVHEGEVVLGDLGLCLDIEEAESGDRVTGENERIGSIHYMPPEAFSRQPADRRQLALDAYSLGKIMYLLLTGSVLPGFEDPMSEDHGIPETGDSRVNAEIRSILRGLLHESPERRVRVLDHLNSRLSSLLGDEEDEDLDGEIEEQISISSEGLTTLVEEAQPRQSLAGLEDEVHDVVDVCIGTIEDSSVLTEFEARVYRPVEDFFDLNGPAEGTELRSRVTGPYTQTRYGFEQISDIGFPENPSIQEGVYLTFQAAESGIDFPTITGGFIVGVEGTSICLGSGIVVDEPDGYVDFARDTINVQSYEPESADLLAEAETEANRIVREFVEKVTEAVEERGIQQ